MRLSSCAAMATFRCSREWLESGCARKERPPKKAAPHAGVPAGYSKVRGVYMRPETACPRDDILRTQEAQAAPPAAGGGRAQPPLGRSGFRVLPAALEAALAKLEPAAKPPKKTPDRSW